ncbi:MAG TPA: tail fiber domain-containing protein [Kofleriaceae bacterium]
MTIKNRTDLKSYFVKNAIPTEGNFADLIDSQLNQSQDGVFKPDGEALSVVAATGDQKRALRLYASYPAPNPDWMIALNPAQDPATAGTSRAGLGVTDGAGRTRLFIDAATGRIGVGTNNPQVALDVVGGVQANGFRGRYDLVLNDYRTVNPASNVCLQSPGNDRDAWIYRDAADASRNWGIYHRQIDSPVAGLPANSIGFIGGDSSRLQAYVNLGDGSGFFAGALSTPAGLIFEGSVPHIDRDGALYRNTDGQCYLTVDDHFYLRHSGTGANWAAHFDTNDGNLELKGFLVASKLWSSDGHVQGADGSLMTDIANLSEPLNKLRALRGVTYRRRDLLDGKARLGLLANEVAGMFPELVFTGRSGERGIEYAGLVALLIEAVKELHDFVINRKPVPG